MNTKIILTVSIALTTKKSGWGPFKKTTTRTFSETYEKIVSAPITHGTRLSYHVWRDEWVHTFPAPVSTLVNKNGEDLLLIEVETSASAKHRNVSRENEIFHHFQTDIEPRLKKQGFEGKGVVAGDKVVKWD